MSASCASTTAGTARHSLVLDHALRLGEGYTSVPSGEPVAVLHREGLTLALRDAEFAARFAVAAGDSFRIFTGGGSGR